MLFVAHPQEPFTIDPGLVWLAAAAVLLSALLLFFAVVLLHRNRDWFGARLRTVDAWLGRHAGGPWDVVKGRLVPGSWQGLALTVSVLGVLGSFYLFAQITDSWMDQGALYRLDRRVHQALDGALGASTLAALRFITHFADLWTAAGVGLVLAALLAWRRHWWRLLALALTLVAGEAILWTMKVVFSRDRPAGKLIETAGESFPSGHAFTGMVLYGFVLYLVWRAPVHPALRAAAATLLLALILAIAVSRVLLSVHWTSDVIGGLLIGLGWLVTSLVLARALQARSTRG